MSEVEGAAFLLWWVKHRIVPLKGEQFKQNVYALHINSFSVIVLNNVAYSGILFDKVEVQER